MMGDANSSQHRRTFQTPRNNLAFILTNRMSKPTMHSTQKVNEEGTGRYRKLYTKL